MELIEAINLAIEFLGKQYFASFDIKYSQDNNKDLLEVHKNENKVDIRYGQKASLFYALTLLKRHYKEKDINISLFRHFDANGLMHDCSRNGPLNIAQAKQMILVSALFGLNRFMLYSEDVYELKDEPFFGYFRGKYTKEELKELDRYASSFGVELVPCIQTLSHLYHVLKWPRFNNIKDTSYTLSVGEEETYQLIDKMLETCKECFSSKNIHIGMDEAIDMASGSFIYKDISLDKKELFLSHLNKVVTLCKNKGLQPMMWGDMFFKLENDNSNGRVDWYQFKGNLSDNTKKLIPDVGLIYWDYYHDDQKVYDRMFEAFKDTNRRVVFADGAISWIGYAPNIIQSMQINEIGIKSAIKHGVKELLITAWGDNGNECSVVSSYPTIALHSMYEFYGKNNKKELSKILETVTGDPLSRWVLLQGINHVREGKMLAFENSSKQFLYQDVLLGLFDYKAKIEFIDKYKTIKRKLNVASNKSKKYGYVYKTLSSLADLLSIKATLGIRLRKAYKNSDKNELKIILKDIKLAANKLRKFKEQFATQWHIENKPFGFEVVDGRLGFTANRLETAYIKLKDYLNGKINNIPELEVDVLSLSNHDDSCINDWSIIASANSI